MGGLSAQPLDRRISWRHAKARAVVDHWTRARPDRAARPPEGQLALEGVGET
jgi:hypothetical protein